MRMNSPPLPLRICIAPQRRWHWAATVASTLTWVLAGPAYADTESSPTPYATTTPDKKFVFVMLTGSAPASTSGRPSGREDTVTQRYPRSGMYKTSGPPVPLWTVDWYSHSVVPLSGGQHLIRPGPWARKKIVCDSGHYSCMSHREPDLDEEAFSFFTGSALLRTYRVADLIEDQSKLSESISHYFWEAASWVTSNRYYHVMTVDGLYHRFDVWSGQRLERRRCAVQQCPTPPLSARTSEWPMRAPNR